MSVTPGGAKCILSVAPEKEKKLYCESGALMSKKLSRTRNIQNAWEFILIDTFDLFSENYYACEAS